MSLTMRSWQEKEQLRETLHVPVALFQKVPCCIIIYIIYIYINIFTMVPFQPAISCMQVSRAGAAMHPAEAVHREGQK